MNSSRCEIQLQLFIPIFLIKKSPYHTADGEIRTYNVPQVPYSQNSANFVLVLLLIEITLDTSGLVSCLVSFFFFKSYGGGMECEILSITYLFCIIIDGLF